MVSRPAYNFVSPQPPKIAMNCSLPSLFKYHTLTVSSISFLKIICSLVLNEVSYFEETRSEALAHLDIAVSVTPMFSWLTPVFPSILSNVLPS